MAFLNFSPFRALALSVAIFLLLLFTFSALRDGATPIQKIKDTAQNAASNLCSDKGPIFSGTSVEASIANLWKSIKHPIQSKTYVDAFGRSFSISDNPHYFKSLGSEIVIVDMDTRFPNNTNQVFNPDRMNWEKMEATEGGGMISASFFNHFLYSQIHGYDYRFFNAHHMEGMHDTWIKPHVLEEMLHAYKFVVFIDADATIQHLEVPLEWLFNRWNITPNTSIAMPIDTKQILGTDENASCDTKGRVMLNSGVVIAQSLPYTFEMMEAWRTCPNETRYPGCGAWKEAWAHEQRAFSEYIRYDYNESSAIVELPCDDAMGYPGLKQNHGHILSDCTGQFIRHHTLDKDMTKTSVANSLLQGFSEIMQKAMKQPEYLIIEPQPEGLEPEGKDEEGEKEDARHEEEESRVEQVEEAIEQKKKELEELREEEEKEKEESNVKNETQEAKVDQPFKQEKKSQEKDEKKDDALSGKSFMEKYEESRD